MTKGIKKLKYVYIEYECEIYVLDFWKNMKKDFPYLSQVTKRTLCVRN